MADRLARDLELLDALDAKPRERFEGVVWRIVRQGRDPLQGYPSGARWDPGTFDVIYTATAREGALAEIHFHLSRQPVFPSKLVSELHRISVRAKRLLRLGDLSEMEALGVARGTFAGLEYGRMQAIGDAAHFLGFDGLLVPSARWSGLNVVLFTGQLAPEDLKIEQSDEVDWKAWRREADALRDQG